MVLMLTGISAAQDIRFPVTIETAVPFYGEPKQQGFNHDRTLNALIKVAFFTFMAFSFFFHRHIGMII